MSAVPTSTIQALPIQRFDWLPIALVPAVMLLALPLVGSLPSVV